jgi:hypothetical protein
VQNFTYTYDLLAKLLSRADANTGLSETFGYDSLNRLTSATVALSPAPLVKTFTYNAIGNITSKSDVGTYSYPAAGQPRPHAVTAISGGSINTTFTYDAKGNMTAGNGLTVAYTSYDKPSSITRGSNTLTFAHDPEHQRFKQVGPGGTTLYLTGSGVLAEKLTGLGGAVTWTNYLVSAGGMVGIFVELPDESTLTRYFHKDHLGSIATITNESGVVLERHDAWGARLEPLRLPWQLAAQLHRPRRLLLHGLLLEVLGRVDQERLDQIPDHQRHLPHRRRHGLRTALCRRGLSDCRRHHQRRPRPGAACGSYRVGHG